MSPMDQNNQGAREPIDRDLLISRVVDDAASAEDWQQLRALAEYDPSVWRELFEAQHAQAELSQAVQQAIAIADGIDAPVEGLGGMSLRFRFRKAASWGGWAGWAVAATVAIVWMAPHLTGTTETAPGANLAGAGPLVTLGGPSPNQPNERRFEAIPDTGGIGQGTLAGDRAYPGENFREASTRSASGAQQLAEVPERVLLEVRPLPNGQLEVIYVRQLIEKSVMDEGDLYQVKPDDAGINRAVPYRQRRPSSGPI